MAELNQITYNPNNWVDDSTPDIEADTLNNIEQGIAQATELLNDLVTEYKNLVSKKMIVNNFLSTNPETVLSGPMGKELKEELERLNRDLGVQRIDNIDIRALSTGRYYTMNSTNLPTGWVAAYLDVERLDAEWCRITAWPPYADISSPQIIKCSLGVWGNWNSITTTSDFLGETLWNGSINSGNIVNISGYSMLGIVMSDANNTSSSRSLVYVPVLNNGVPYFIPALYSGHWTRLRIAISTAGMLSIVESEGAYITAVYGYGRK